MENFTEKNKWVAIVFDNLNEKTASYHLNDKNRTYDEAEKIASVWVSERFKNYDWVLHKIV
jgi:hypothetical protein